MIAGLSMLVAGSLSGFGINMAIGIIAGVTTFGSAFGSTGFLFWLIASSRWEGENELRIMVER